MPYDPYTANPCAEGPDGELGFQAYAHFPGPDGYMHMTAVNPFERPPDQTWPISHHVSRDGIHWTFVERLAIEDLGPVGLRTAPPAPHVVWDGVPGDRGRPLAFVDQFADSDGLMKVRLFAPGMEVAAACC